MANEYRLHVTYAETMVQAPTATAKLHTAYAETMVQAPTATARLHAAYAEVIRTVTLGVSDRRRQAMHGSF